MQEQLTFGLPKPGRVLTVAMILVGALWVLFAVGLNWAGASPTTFELLVGSDAVWRGQIWRLLTNFLVHQPAGPGASSHLLTTLMGLYFLGSSLEERWGGRRFALFLVGSGVFASVLQLLLGLVISTLHADVFYGGLGVVDAVAVAWALSFKDRQVRLFFVLPVSGMGLILFVLAMNVLYVLAVEGRHEGLITPFGGMLAGFLFADGSPLRKAYLQWKFRRLQGQSAALRGVRAQNIPNLRVIKGGGGKVDKSQLN